MCLNIKMKIEYLSKKLEKEELIGTVLSVDSGISGRTTFLFECEDWERQEGFKNLE